MSIIGVDIGTMFICGAKQINGKDIEIETMRNMFLPITDEIMNISEIANTQIDYVEADDEDGEKSVYIVSEDAYKFGNIFNQPVKRPMSKGVISPGEIDAIDVLTLMIDRLIGGKVKTGQCVYSVPATAIDLDIPPVIYHEKVFGKIFNSLGYEAQPINEAMAIIYSECQKENFSGIAISFGSGLTNVACAYKGTPTLTFAVSRGGDWIDSNSASSLGLISNKITAIKEKPDMNLINPTCKNKKERRVREAIAFYYKNLIEYIIKIFINKFEEDSDGLDIDEAIPIIISGGTSKPNGFIDVFKSIFENHKDFPYEISEIRYAKDPLHSVATGCLIYALWSEKRKKAGTVKEGEKNEN